MKFKCDACNRIEFLVEKHIELLNEEKIGVMNRVMLDQRVVYIKRLLEDSGLLQYGITEAEIKSFASRPVTETITILIELRKLVIIELWIVGLRD